MSVKVSTCGAVSGAGFYIKLNRKSKWTILACGGQLKNTFCVAKGDIMFVSPTFGDLDRLENYEAFRSSIGRFFTKKERPDLVAFDLHPEYLSTKYAHTFSGSDKIAIQHHYAHMASALAGSRPNGKVIGITFDGTGFGLDGNIWGGEFLVGNLKGFERKAHLKYVPMPGAEQAIKEPWRMAASWLYEIYGEDFLNLKIEFSQQLDKHKWAILKKMMDKKINSPLTSSIGRLFDAVSALMGIRSEIEYEAQAAVELEGIADGNVRDFYQFNIDSEEGLYIVDPAPLFISLIEDLKKKVAPSIMSAKFHNSISNMIDKVSVKLRDAVATEKIVLSGGVFLNRYLTDRVRPQLLSKGFESVENERVAVADSGISVGQALIAGAAC